MRPGRPRTLLLALTAAALLCARAQANPLTEADVRLMVRVLGFLRPAPRNDGTIAIVYDAADPASWSRARTIASYFGTGLKAGNATLTARVVSVDGLSNGGFVAIIAPGGVTADLTGPGPGLTNIPCLTGDLALVREGHCTLAVRSYPRPDVTLSRAAAAKSGINFASAFLMMINQL
jgi:hypothetical protein